MFYAMLVAVMSLSGATLLGMHDSAPVPSEPVSSEIIEINTHIAPVKLAWVRPSIAHIWGIGAQSAMEEFTSADSASMTRTFGNPNIISTGISAVLFREGPYKYDVTYSNGEVVRKEGWIKEGYTLHFSPRFLFRSATSQPSGYEYMNLHSRETTQFGLGVELGAGISMFHSKADNCPMGLGIVIGHDRIANRHDTSACLRSHVRFGQVSTGFDMGYRWSNLPTGGLYGAFSIGF